MKTAINLSVRALEEAEEREAMKSMAAPILCRLRIYLWRSL